MFIIFWAGCSEGSHGHCLPAKRNAYNLYTWFTARWRIVAVSSGLENPHLDNLPLDNCNWRVQSDSDWVAWSSPLSRKKNVLKHQFYAKQCILHALRHKTHSLILSGTLTDHALLLHMPIGSLQVWHQTIGTCRGPGFGENRSDFREKWTIARGKTLIMPVSQEW